MSFEQTFNRILKLINRTGDRVIVWDRQEPSEPFVLMPLSRYEDLAVDTATKPSIDSGNPALTGEDLADKINVEISNWKHEDDSQYIEEEFKARNPWKIPEGIKRKAQADEEEKR